MATNSWIELPAYGSPSWKSPVANAGSLPATGNTNGDTRVDLSTDTIYIWNGASWIAVATPGAAIAIDGLIGDVVASGPGVVTATIQPNVVTNAKLAQMPADTMKGNNTGVTANAMDLTVPQIQALLGYGTGSVTSVAMTVPAFLSVSGSPITTSGTLAVSLSGTALPVANGGTSLTTLTLNNVILGNGSSAPTFVAPGTSGNILTSNGTTWLSSVPATSGTVTSVALTMPSIFSVSGSPITSNGTLGVTLNTETANTVFAGPTSGGAATPAFRALVTADLPAGVQSTITIGALDAQAENANGLALVANVLSSQSADTTHPGMVNNTTQSFSGVKTFTNNVAISTASTTALTLATSAFVFDSTNFALGINNAAPSTATFIDGINTSNATKRLLLTGYGSASLVGFRTRLARNTVGSPQAVQAGDILGFFNSEGYGATTFPATATGALTILAGETFTDSSNQTYVTINSTPSGAVNSTENFRVASTGVTIGPQSSSTLINVVSGGLRGTTRTITGNLTIDTTTADYVIFCNNTTGITVTLPAPTNGRILKIKDIKGTAQTNNVTIAQHASEKIEGLAASFAFQTNFGAIELISDGTDWWIT